jgi:hypothetical protein
MALLPEPVIDDDVRAELKSAMEQTGASAELVSAIGTVEVDTQPEPARDHPKATGRGKRRRLRS